MFIEKAKVLIEHVKKTGGCHELNSGAWLVRGDELIAEQKKWDKFDESKNRVFKADIVYVQTDDGFAEEADAEDLADPAYGHDLEPK